MPFNATVLITIAIVLGIAFLGSLFSQSGMIWYKTITLPSITPPGWFIGNVWTILYILITIAILQFVSRDTPKNQTRLILLVYGLNGLFNALWTYLFFYLHSPKWALFDIIALVSTILMLILLQWQYCRISSYLLLPYAVWVFFAGYLNYQIIVLNR